MAYGVGARVGFFQGDIRLLPDDMKTLQPTIFPVVPRLLNRVYDRVRHSCQTPRPTLSSSSALRISPTRFSSSLCHQVQSGAKSPFKKWLLNFAVDRKYAEVQDGIIRKNSIWDKLIFSKIQVLLQVIVTLQRGATCGVKT